MFGLMGNAGGLAGAPKKSWSFADDA